MITAPEGVTQAVVDRAELAVCLHIGLDTLEVANHYETGTLRGSIITLRRPASRLGSVMIGETALTEHAAQLTPYGVRLPGAYCGPYEVTYRTGWAPEALPAAIRQAVLLTAETAGALAGAEIPEGVQSIRLPEISVQFAGASGHQYGALPGVAQQLLRPWVKVRL